MLERGSFSQVGLFLLGKIALCLWSHVGLLSSLTCAWVHACLSSMGVEEELKDVKCKHFNESPKPETWGSGCRLGIRILPALSVPSTCSGKKMAEELNRFQQQVWNPGPQEVLGGVLLFFCHCPRLLLLGGTTCNGFF